MSNPGRTNRLVKESSPYLQRHAHQPVDWYPWCQEAVKRARDENRPIILSIGYSTCHWCRLMERECFDNEEIANLMNSYFINIKVDREERPDVDSIYQAAVQLAGQPGGWPLTVFLTPDLEPFYWGTYFPPENRGDLPGFPSVLKKIVTFYRNEQEQIQESVKKVKEALAKINESPKARAEPLSGLAIPQAADRLLQQFDSVHGGFGTRPKFPNALSLSFLMRAARRSGNKDIIDKVAWSLRKMIEGGIYDQLGGGFHRYANDAEWLAPHFEKMLYDNALITIANLEAFQLTGEPVFERAARETIDFVLRELTAPDGSFYAALGADSDGIEGKYYLWTTREIMQVAGEESGSIFCSYCGPAEQAPSSDAGGVLHIKAPIDAVASDAGISVQEVSTIIADVRLKLLKHREQRSRPFRDEKIIVAWNSLMIQALAKAAVVLEEESFAKAAEQAAGFILENMFDGATLRHQWVNGKALLNGFLDDYAFFTGALLDVFEVTQERRYLDRAVDLAQATLLQFQDERHGGFYYVPREHERLLLRLKLPYDDAVPSGTSAAVMNLLRLFALTERIGYREPAVQILRMRYKDMVENPFAFPALLAALDAQTEGIHQIVVVGFSDDPEVWRLLRTIQRSYVPNKVIFLVFPGENLGEKVPDTFKEKIQVDGKPTLYVCKDFVCSAPATSWEEVVPVIEKAAALEEET